MQKKQNLIILVAEINNDFLPTKKNKLHFLFV